MDGAMYPYAHDPDCVAFKWKLSSSHPCDDICDLYARADLWGDGRGHFPERQDACRSEWAKEVQKGASWKQYARGYSDEVMQCRITNGIMQAGRPANEQDELKQFVFIGDKKTAAEKHASVNPHYHEGREWQINCQRCVVVEAVENIVGGDKNE